MAVVTLVNGSSLTYAIASAEVGCNVEEYKETFAPQFITDLQGANGITRCDAYGPAELELDISGETNGAGSGSCLAAVIGTAFVPVNTVSTFWNAPTTGLYWQGGSLTRNRAGFQRFDAKFKSKPGIP